MDNSNNKNNHHHLEPCLFDRDDVAEDLAYKRILDGVISQATAPAEAARQMDAWITAEASSRYASFQQRVPPFSLSDEERNSLYVIAPNPSRHIGMMVASMARASSSYPPGHVSQEALIDFIRQLRDVPKHSVPEVSYDEHDVPVWAHTTIWPFGSRQGTEALAQRFQREVDDFAYPFSDVEALGSEVQLRYRNLQSFMARITTSDLVDCSSASALWYILPSSHTYPDLDERKVGGPRRIAADLEAAAQWLMPDEARRWVRDRCRENAGGPWNEHNWRLWISQLTFFAGDERFPEATRALASSVKLQMEGS